MTASELLADLNERGVQLHVDSGALRWRAPQGAMNTELVRAIKANKAELIALLPAPEADPVSVDPGMIWWDDAVPEHSTPPRLIPPRTCPFPIACSRLGCCDRHQTGEPCLIAKGVTDAA